MPYRAIFVGAFFPLVLVAGSGRKSARTIRDRQSCDSQGRSLLQQAGNLHALESDAMEEGSHLRSTASSKNLLVRMFGGHGNSEAENLDLDLAIIARELRKNDGIISTSHIKELFNSSQSPKGMARYITEKLLPEAEEATTEMQHDMDDATDAVSNCSTLMWNAEKEMRHREKVLSKDDSEAMRCLTRENELVRIQKDACDKLKSKIAQTIDVMRKTEIPESTADAVEKALKEQLHFYSIALPEFKQDMSACGNATKEVEKQKEECVVDKKIINHVYCQMKKKRDEACAEYDQCYKDASSQFENVKKHVKETEQYNKDHFQNMACASIVKDTTRCEGNMTDVTHLDVTYQLLPEQETCVPISWTRLDHSTVDCSGVPDELLPDIADGVKETTTAAPVETSNTTVPSDSDNFSKPVTTSVAPLENTDMTVTEAPAVNNTVANASTTSPENTEGQANGTTPPPTVGPNITTPEEDAVTDEADTDASAVNGTTAAPVVVDFDALLSTSPSPDTEVAAISLDFEKPTEKPTSWWDQP